MNNKGAIPIVAILIFTALQVIVMKGAEIIDHQVVNKERYKTQTPDFRKGVNVWGEKLKIETNDKHDAKALPPGLTVDVDYKTYESIHE